MNTNTNIRRVCIIDGMRTPFVRSFMQFSDLTTAQLMSKALKALVEKKSLQNEQLGEVVLGSVMKRTSDWNLAREAVMESGLSPKTPAFDLIRACATGLEAAVAVRNKIALGQIEVGIAGGVDSNSDIPLVFSKAFSQKLFAFKKAKSLPERISALSKFSVGDLRPELPMVVEPKTGLSMGQHCELMAKEWQISRADQDQLTYESHQKAAKAWEEGFYKEFVLPVNKVAIDTNVRKDTSLEKLAKLKPVFDTSAHGTLTAGNSTPLTDGASCVLLCSEEYAKRKGWRVLAYFDDAVSTGVDYTNGAGLLMAPVEGIIEILKRNNLSWSSFDYYEIHEAFAAQVLCTLKALAKHHSDFATLDRNKLNVKGGSVALGHPFAATGARILVGASKILEQNNAKRSLISICTGGGMGVVGVISRP